MTKKINSLLFRLGTNSMWNVKVSNFSNIFNTLRLNQALHSELIKYKWNILRIKWNNLEASIQVYDSFAFSKKTKQKIFRYFKAIKNVKKLSEKFSISVIFLSTIFKKIKFLETKLNYINLKLSSINLLYKLKQLQRILKFLISLNSFNWVKINLFIGNLLQLKNNKISFKSHWNFKITNINFQLQKINGFLYFRILGISIGNILYFFTRKTIKIDISNIWQNQGWTFKFLFKDKFIFKLLFLSCFFKNTKLFSEFIALQLQKNKNHKKILRKITLIIENFWKNYIVNLIGIQLRITGKLNGSMRKSKYHYDIGKVQLQTLKIILSYSLSFSYTKFGIISTKFWILHGNK